MKYYWMLTLLIAAWLTLPGCPPISDMDDDDSAATGDDDDATADDDDATADDDDTTADDDDTMGDDDDTMGDDDDSMGDDDDSSADDDDFVADDDDSSVVSPCVHFCEGAVALCSGANEQYASVQACMEACGTWAPGAPGDAAGNTLACREYHLGAAQGDAATHCPQTGADGGGVCID